MIGIKRFSMIFIAIKPLKFIVLTLSLMFINQSHSYSNEDDIDAGNAFTLGIIPQQSGKKIRTLWRPLTQYIQKQTNYPIHLSGSPNIPTFENRLFTGKFDLAYVNPRLFLEANKHVGYHPIVREQNKKLKGIIVVAKNSSHKTIHDLKGAHFVSPKGAFAASALTRINLHNLKLNVKNSFVDTHTQGYFFAANGSADAAGGVLRTFNSLKPELKDKLRILWTSKGVTPHAFIIHPRVNEKVKQRITDAIISFQSTKEGKAFYKALRINPFTQAKLQDWNDVKELMGY